MILTFSRLTNSARTGGVVCKRTELSYQFLFVFYASLLIYCTGARGMYLNRFNCFQLNFYYYLHLKLFIVNTFFRYLFSNYEVTSKQKGRTRVWGTFLNQNALFLWLSREPPILIFMRCHKCIV